MRPATREYSPTGPCSYWHHRQSTKEKDGPLQDIDRVAGVPEKDQWTNTEYLRDVTPIAREAVDQIGALA